MPVLKKYYN